MSGANVGLLSNNVYQCCLLEGTFWSDLLGLMDFHFHSKQTADLRALVFCMCKFIFFAHFLYLIVQ